MDKVASKKSIFFWFAVISLVLASILAQVWLHNVRSETRANINLFAEELPNAILNFERSVGYAGFIHNFKNFVLRPEEQAYAVAAIAQYDQALVELDALRALAQNAGIPFDSESVRSTLEEYSLMLAEIATAAKGGASAREIDRIVKIDDAAASKALTDFTEQMKLTFTAHVGGQIASLTRILILTSALSVLLPVTIAIFAFLLQREQKGSLAASEKLNEVLSQSNRELERSNRVFAEFAYVSSHDLRTPIRSIANNVHLIGQDHSEALPEEVRQRLGKIQKQCEITDKMLGDLERYSRTSSGKKKARVSVAKIIFDLEASLNATEGETNWLLTVETDLPDVFANLQEMKLLFGHLVHNGINHNNSDIREVYIGFLAEKSFQNRAISNVFYVSDNGLGIAEEMISDVFRIFKKLQQTDNATLGTGSGLALARKIIENQGGEIWIVSNLGQGTTVYFSLSPTNV